MLFEPRQVFGKFNAVEVNVGTAALVTVPFTTKSLAEELTTSKIYHVPVAPVAPYGTIRKETVEVDGKFCNAGIVLKSTGPAEAPDDAVVGKEIVVISIYVPPLIEYWINALGGPVAERR
jgi:hypothetical protein